MMTKLKKNNSMKALVFILIIAISITMLPMAAMADDNDPLDVTKYVSRGGFDFFQCDNSGNMTKSIIKDGQLVGDPEIKNGDNIGLKYYWNISSENMQYVTTGSFFLVDLPNDIKFDPISGSVDLRTSDGKYVVAKMQLITENTGSQVLKVTINETGAKANNLKDGWLLIFGSVKLTDENATEASIFEITVPVETDEPDPGTDPGKKPDNPSDRSNFTWYDQGGGTDISKSSTNPEKYTGLTKFTLNVNKEMYVNKFTDNGNYEIRNGVMIIDKLQDGIVYSGGLNLSTAMYYVLGKNTTNAALEPVSPTKMSSKSIPGTSMNLTNQLTLRTPTNPTMSFEDFQKYIKNQEPLSYGIWQNKALVINFGSLEGELTFNDLTWKDLNKKIDADSQIVTYTEYERDATGDAILDVSGKAIVKNTTTYEALSSEVKLQTKQAYASFFGVPVDDMDNEDYLDNKGSVVGLTISFNTNVTGTDRKVTNVAIMQYDGENHSSNQTSVNYVQMSGGADFDAGSPGDVRLIKLDGETYNPLKGVQFKLQKFDQATRKYEDLSAGAPGSGVKETSTDGSILFKNLDWGKYRIVEVKNLDGYTPNVIFKDDKDTFELADPTEVLEFIAYNYKEDTMGEEGYSTDDQGNVLGDEALPDGNVLGDEASSVKGEESQTSDITNIALLLVTLLIVMITLLAIILTNRKREEQ